MFDRLVAGDTLNFLTATPGYPAADGWQLKFRLVPRTAGNSVIELGSVAEGDDHRTQATAATTASWAADTYTWSSWVELSGEKYSLRTAQHCVVLPDPRTLTAGTDGRSLPRRTLDDLLAARATWAATHGRTRSYKIGDRERTFATAAELDAEIRFWQGQLADEVAADRLAAGLPSHNRLLVRFSRPR